MFLIGSCFQNHICFTFATFEAWIAYRLLMDMYDGVQSIQNG